MPRVSWVLTSLTRWLSDALSVEALGRVFGLRELFWRRHCSQKSRANFIAAMSNMGLLLVYPLVFSALVFFRCCGLLEDIFSFTSYVPRFGFYDFNLLVSTMPHKPEEIAESGKSFRLGRRP